MAITPKFTTSPVGKVKPSSSGFAFWGPMFEDENGSLFSPGFTEDVSVYNIYDKVIFTINGKKVTTPGCATVRFLRQKDKDKKKSVGQDSTTTTTSGIKAAEIVIELDLWMPEHKYWLDLYLPILFPKPNKSPQVKATPISTTTVIGITHPLPGSIINTDNVPSNSTAQTQTIPNVVQPKAAVPKAIQPTFAVQHPLFVLSNIKAVVLHSWEGPLPHSVVRGKVFRLHCTEYQPTTKIQAGGTAETPSRAKEESIKAGVNLPGKDQAMKIK